MALAPGDHRGMIVPGRTFGTPRGAPHCRRSAPASWCSSCSSRLWLPSSCGGSGRSPDSGPSSRVTLAHAGGRRRALCLTGRASAARAVCPWRSTAPRPILPRGGGRWRAAHRCRRDRAEPLARPTRERRRHDRSAGSLSLVPSSSVGRGSLRLAVVRLVSPMVFYLMCATGQRRGDGFFDNWFLAGSILVVAVTGIAGLVGGCLAVPPQSRARTPGRNPKWRGASWWRCSRSPSCSPAASRLMASTSKCSWSR
jgi:hypothetical protein